MERKPLSTYSTLCSEFYDLEEHVNHAQALSFYLKHARQASGPILEPMCGSGRFLIPLLQEGLEAEGFDASPSMLDSLRQKYSELSSQPAPVWQAFVQDFQPNKLYNLVFIPYGSWGLIIDPDEAKKSLESLYHALAHDGKLILEIDTVASAPEICNIERHGRHVRADGAMITLNFVASYNSQTQLFQSRSRYELIVNNNVVSREDELFEQYLYRIDELDQILCNEGFVFKKYPAFDPTQTVKNDTPIIVYECSRR